MKLYSASLSPFAARPRLAIYAKGLDIEILEPPGGAGSDAYKAVNPIGKVPALVLDDGTVIPESDTIVEYLEDRFPTPSLRPATPEGVAQARLLARVGDLYVTAAGGGLFAQVNPATRDAKVVDETFARLDGALAYLNVFLGEGPYAIGETLTTADCTLAPMMFFMGVFGRVFQREDFVVRHGKVAAYGRHIGADPHVARIHAEMGAALAARMAAAAG
jgi:glutathione S-transferase